MTELFNNGFEEGNFTAWTGTEGTPTVSSTIKHHGNYALYADPASGAGEDAYKSGLSIGAIGYERFYVYIDSGLPANNGELCMLGGIGATDYQNAVFPQILRSGGANYWSVAVWIGGVNTANPTEASASNPSLDTWYCIEVLRDVTNSRTKLWVNGVLKIDVASSHSGNNNRIWAGSGYITVSGHAAYHDCVITADAYIGVEGAAAGQPYISRVQRIPGMMNWGGNW